MNRVRRLFDLLTGRRAQRDLEWLEAYVEAHEE